MVDAWFGLEYWSAPRGGLQIRTRLYIYSWALQIQDMNVYAVQPDPTFWQ